MMRCDQFERLLHVWMDEALAPEEAMEMRAHTDACPGCGKLACALREALEACRELGGEAEVPQAASQSWRRAVRAESANAAARRKRLPTPRWRALAGLAAGILVLIGGANLVRLGRTNFEPMDLVRSSVANIGPIARNEPQEPTESETAPAPQADASNAMPDMVATDISKALFAAPPPAAVLSEFSYTEPESGTAFDESLRMRREDADANEEVLEQAMPVDDAVGGMLLLSDAESDAEWEAEEPPQETVEDERKSEEAMTFLLDAGIFLLLCLPPAVIALCIVRRRKHKKRVQKK